MSLKNVKVLVHDNSKFFRLYFLDLVHLGLSGNFCDRRIL